MVLFSLHGGFCFFSAFLFVRLVKSDQDAPFKPFAAIRKPPWTLHGWWLSLLNLAIVIYPLIYLVSLVYYIGKLEAFSIQLPSSVFSRGIVWMVMAAPGLVLGAALLSFYGLRLRLRLVLYVYGAVAVLYFWGVFWEYFHQLFLVWIGHSNGEPVFFSFAVEERFRFWVRAVWYGWGLLLGIIYLTNARNAAVFWRRGFFLGLPTLLLFMNLHFITGDSNHYFSALRDLFYRHQHFTAYKAAARIQLARAPDSFEMPYVLETLLEMEYQEGDTARAFASLERLLQKTKAKPYYGELSARWLTTQKNWKRNRAADKEGIPTRDYILDLPIIKPAGYLNDNWYSLLSAVAYLNPGLSDLNLKKRLLELSSSVQLSLPLISNIPELVPILKQMGVPYTVCFLDVQKLGEAIRQNHIPYLYYEGQWIVLSGIDSQRGGFYYYKYANRGEGRDLFRNNDIGLFYDGEEESFQRRRENLEVRKQRYGVQRFLPAAFLESHLLDIGGIGVVLGDSNFADAAEASAALLAEQGDVYYQEQEDYRQAAQCYMRANGLHASSYIVERMIYLKRKYRHFAEDNRLYQNLFRESYPPDWIVQMGLEEEDEKALIEKMLSGECGNYMLFNWYSMAPEKYGPDDRSVMLDTLIRTYVTLSSRKPYEPAYLDSLAAIYGRMGEWEESEALCNRLLEFYPFGHEHIAYRLSWVRFKLRRMEEMQNSLQKCPGYRESAGYSVMQGAYFLQKGRLDKAFKALNKSLKIDKTLPEAHELLIDYYTRKSDGAAVLRHKVWLQRTL